METVDKNPPSVLSDPQEGEHPAINFLWVILDGSKLTDGQKKKIGRRYKAFSLKPSHIFDSNGSRCVLLWSLKKTTPEDIPKPVIENLLKRLASHFYGDPGIPDLPQDLPQWEIAESHPERKYNIEDFDFCLPQIEGIQGEELPDEVSENHIEAEPGPLRRPKMAMSILPMRSLRPWLRLISRLTNPVYFGHCFEKPTVGTRRQTRFQLPSSKK